MLYNLLFSATFLKDFSHLQGPPEGPEWSHFKSNTFAYVIQKHEDSITNSGKKHLYFISNTQDYLAFGIYTSIRDYARLGKVSGNYELRRRAGDKNTNPDPLAGDYQTEAAVGGFWFKRDTDTLGPGKYIDVDLDKLLKIYDQEIVPFWYRDRNAIRQVTPDILESPLKISDTPTYRIDEIDGIIKDINRGEKTLLKVNEDAEINLFYALIHNVINGNITEPFNFCTQFNSKKLFDGQKFITLGTIRGGGAVKARNPINPTSVDNLNPRNPIIETDLSMQQMPAAIEAGRPTAAPLSGAIPSAEIYAPPSPQEFPSNQPANRAPVMGQKAPSLVGANIPPQTQPVDSGTNGVNTASGTTNGQSGQLGQPAQPTTIGQQSIPNGQQPSTTTTRQPTTNGQLGQSGQQPATSGQRPSGATVGQSAGLGNATGQLGQPTTGRGVGQQPSGQLGATAGQPTGISQQPVGGVAAQLGQSGGQSTTGQQRVTALPTASKPVVPSKVTAIPKATTPDLSKPTVCEPPIATTTTQPTTAQEKAKQIADLVAAKKAAVLAKRGQAAQTSTAQPEQPTLVTAKPTASIQPTQQTITQPIVKATTVVAPTVAKPTPIAPTESQAQTDKVSAIQEAKNAAMQKVAKLKQQKQAKQIAKQETPPLTTQEPIQAESPPSMPSKQLAILEKVRLAKEKVLAKKNEPMEQAVDQLVPTTLASNPSPDTVNAPTQPTKSNTDTQPTNPSSTELTKSESNDITLVEQQNIADTIPVLDNDTVAFDQADYDNNDTVDTDNDTDIDTQSLDTTTKENELSEQEIEDLLAIENFSEQELQDLLDFEELAEQEIDTIVESLVEQETQDFETNELIDEQQTDTLNDIEKLDLDNHHPNIASNEELTEQETTTQVDWFDDWADKETENESPITRDELDIDNELSEEELAYFATQSIDYLQQEQNIVDQSVVDQVESEENSPLDDTSVDDVLATTELETELDLDTTNDDETNVQTLDAMDDDTLVENLDNAQDKETEVDFEQDIVDADEIDDSNKNETLNDYVENDFAIDENQLSFEDLVFGEKNDQTFVEQDTELSTTTNELDTVETKDNLMSASAYETQIQVTPTTDKDTISTKTDEILPSPIQTKTIHKDSAPTNQDTQQTEIDPTTNPIKANVAQVKKAAMEKVAAAKQAALQRVQAARKNAENRKE